MPLARPCPSIPWPNSESASGRLIADTNDYKKGFARIVEDNSHYYLLGYDSTNQSHDGLYHANSVHVKPKGLTVRARTTHRAR